MDLTDAERQAIVKFEMSLFSAQSREMAAGDLDAKGAEGGALPLSKQPFVSSRFRSFAGSHRARRTSTTAQPRRSTRS